MAASLFPVPAVDSRASCAAGWYCTTRRRNAHGTEVREVLYRWHPWAGWHVHIHEQVERAGSVNLRCSKTGATSDRWLEIPAWMFDPAACALARMGASPQVDVGALSALVKLLRAAAPVSALSDSSAASGPHDSHSGGLNAAQVQDVATRPVLLPTRFRDIQDTTVGHPASADTPDVDVVDGAPVARALRRSRCGAAGGAR